MRSIRVLPSADKDLDEAAIYYAEEAGAEVALRFLKLIEIMPHEVKAALAGESLSGTGG